MFPELQALIGNPDQLPDKKFIFVTERNADGAFVLYHFLGHYVKQDYPVFMVTLYQSFFHHSCVGMKLGFNLMQHRNKGKLVLIEGLKLAAEYQKTCSGQSAAVLSDNPFSAILNSDTPSLDKLFSYIQREFERLKDLNGPFLFVIDDMSSFLFLGVPVKEIVCFTRACYRLCNPDSHSAGCFLSLIHRTPKGCEDEENDMLTLHTSHICDVLVEVEGLETGFCKDVHGQIAITVMDPLFREEKISRSIQSMQFKEDERKVQIFAAGLSPAVL